MPLPQDVAHQARKAREIALLQRHLRTRLALPPPSGTGDVHAQKLRIASVLRAEHSLENWAITETAHPEVHEWRCGAFRLSYGYQRADLRVQGPPIYPALAAIQGGLVEETLYTASGMSAIAILVTALLQVHGSMSVFAVDAGYGETRELLQRFGSRIRVSRLRRAPGSRAAGSGAGVDCAPARAAGSGAHVVWLDSAVAADFDAALRSVPPRCDLVVVDTTCFWSGSSRLRRLLRAARQRNLPLALVRSHAKLDCLGIEYGRMGSLVLAWPRGATVGWMRELLDEARKSLRLLGCGAVPAHFPPFTRDYDYAPCSAGRTASIIRATRRLARRLEASALRASVRRFQHGLYVTLAPRGGRSMRDIGQAVDGLCGDLAASGLPVRHAGSFGFDFVAIDQFPDPATRRTVMRIAPGDLPSAVIDAVSDGIVRWLEARWLGATSSGSTTDAPSVPCEECTASTRCTTISRQEISSAA
jgi:hypothetical protein